MAILETFLEGNRRTYTATFKVPDANGVLTDPTTVTFYRRKIGSGSLTDLETYLFPSASEVTRLSVGVFVFTISFPDDGRYVVGAKGTGDCEAYDEIDIDVKNAKARA